VGAKLSLMIDSLSDRFIPDSLRQDADVLRHAKRVAIYDLSFIGWSVFFSVIYAAMGCPTCVWVVIWTNLLFCLSLAALKHGRAPALCGDLTCLSGWCTLSALAFLQGGWLAPSLMWYSVLPVLAALTGGVARAVVWTLIPLVSSGAFAVAYLLGFPFPQYLTPGQLSVFNYAALAGLMLCQSFMACIRLGVEQRALAALFETNRRLADARRHLQGLQTSYGFSPDEWATLKREKAALEYALNLLVEGGELIDDEELIDKELRERKLLDDDDLECFEDPAAKS
jgi:hypothetical protein